MKKRGRLSSRLMMVGVLGVGVSSCGANPMPSGPSQSQDVGTSVKPTTECAPFLEGHPCMEYSSTAGTSDGRPIMWPADGAITARLDRVGGRTYLTAKLPCGPVNAPVKINGSAMIVDGEMAIGASGCVDAGKGEQQTWTLELIRKGVQMTIVNDVFTWTNGQDAVSFRPTR
jgi:hypothetical protein